MGRAGRDPGRPGRIVPGPDDDAAGSGDVVRASQVGRHGADPADTVVKVVETRPYGSYLVTEVPDGPAVKRAIKALRPMVEAMPYSGGVGELIGRFPEEGETPVPVEPAH